MKYIKYLIISTLIFIFQSTLCQYIAIAGIKPNIMLIFVVTIAFLKGEDEGLLSGITTGLLQDCYFGPVIGCNLFLYGIIGYLAGCLAGHFNKENIIAPIVIIFVSTLAYNSGFYLLNIILRGYTAFNLYFILNILPELVYNVILEFALYIAAYYIGSSIKITRKNHRF